MSREIKFRAWDNIKKDMICTGYHVIGEVTIFGMIDQWVQEHRGETPSLEYYNSIIEMQYTGLTDKNGVVDFDEGMFGLINTIDDQPYTINRLFIEVIGNIYQNPELTSQPITIPSGANSVTNTDQLTAAKKTS